MAVFSTGSVTKLRAQGPSSSRPEHMHTYMHKQIMLLVRQAKMAKNDKARVVGSDVLDKF